MASTWAGLLCSTILIAVNTALTPTDAMFGLPRSRTWNAAFKCNPVACGLNVLYSLFDLYRLLRSTTPTEVSLKDFTTKRTAEWDGRDDPIIQALSSNQSFRNIVALGSVVSAINVFVLVECRSGVRIMCAAYIAEFILDAMVRVYAAKWRISSKSPQSLKRNPESNITIDVLSQASLLLPTLALMSGPTAEARQLFVVLSVIAATVEIAYNPSLAGAFITAISTTFSGMLWTSDLFFAGTVGINLAIVCFLLSVFSLRTFMGGREHWIYIGGIFSMLLFAFLLALGNSPVKSIGFGPRPPFDVEDADQVTWWMYLRYYSGYLFPGSGPVANTALCFVFMWLIWSMMSNPSALVPSDR